MKLSADGKRKTAREERVPAFMQLGNETGFPHEGYIDFVDNRIDPGTGTMRARAVFKAWNWLLTPGFFVRLRVPGAPPAIVTLVDDKVISSEQGQKFVFVVNADTTLERRTIVTGAMNEGLRIVREGLGADEKVVSARLMILMPDMSVQPIPEPARSTQVAK